jgi:hypothetical protein
MLAPRVSPKSLRTGVRDLVIEELFFIGGLDVAASVLSIPRPCTSQFQRIFPLSSRRLVDPLSMRVVER